MIAALRRLLSVLLSCLSCLPCLWLLACAAPAAAQPMDLPGAWRDADTGAPVARVANTGGRFVHEAVFELRQGGRYVLDFRNGHVLGRFEHRLFDAAGQPLAQFEGGLQGEQFDPFFLRHGRELALAPGRYRLQTTLHTPYVIAPPEPYLDTLAHYRQATRLGNAISLAGLGVLVGLGVYYACLALVRRRAAEGLYAAFIAGNLAFNAASSGLAHDLFGITWFHLSTVPILFSNMAYIGFVMSLLRLRATEPWLARLGFGVIGAMALMAAWAAWQPQHAMEACRYGVGLFLGYGLLAGVRRVRAGDRLARWYLVANVGFVLSGGAAITLADMGGLHSITVEHVGLVAVVIEVLLLALVLAWQFGDLQRTTAAALAEARRNLALAHTDSLTGLPNRHAFEAALAALPAGGALSFIDLDGLKAYNDRHGHAEGDRLLRAFGRVLQQHLQGRATLYRLGGDEFVALAPAAGPLVVEAAVATAVQALRQDGFDTLGASVGSVQAGEAADAEALQALADRRMYEHKGRRRAERGLSSPAAAPA